MTPFDEWVFRCLREKYGYSRMAVRTLAIAVEMGRHDWTVRRALRRLEQQGYVQRRKQRGGWYPVLAAA